MVAPLRDAVRAPEHKVDGVEPFDMDVEYLQFGGTVSYPDTEVTHVIPYFGMTVGAARFSPDGAGLDDETKFAFTIGGGVRIPINDRFGVRLDLRALTEPCWTPRATSSASRRAA